MHAQYFREDLNVSFCTLYIELFYVLLPLTVFVLLIIKRDTMRGLRETEEKRLCHVLCRFTALPRIS